MDIEPLTEDEKALWPKHPMVSLPSAFEDARGRLQPLVDIPMKSAVLIESKKHSIRANHYHKTDWHYCYVLSGCMRYYFRPTGSAEEPDSVRVGPGEMVFTPPMVDHAMIFEEDTVFVTLSRNPRDQASYEADVVRVEIVTTEGLTSWKPSS